MQNCKSLAIAILYSRAPSPRSSPFTSETGSVLRCASASGGLGTRQHVTQLSYDELGRVKWLAKQGST
jgi:hypothetical protein